MTISSFRQIQGTLPARNPKDRSRLSELDRLQVYPEDSQTGTFRQNSTGLPFGTSGHNAAENERDTPGESLFGRSEREADRLKAESHAGAFGR